MNLIKLLGALLLLICASSLGFYYSYKLKLRLSFLRSFIDFLSNLETNIRYFCDDIFKLIKISAPADIGLIFEMKNNVFNNYWCDVINNIPEIYGLKNDDYSLLEQFGAMLGTTDVEGQLNHIKLYKTIFQAQYDNLKNEYKTKSRLYKALGFFAGATLALMLI